MENKKEEKNVVFEEFNPSIEEYVKKIVKPIFEAELAKETDKNRMSVGSVRFSDKVFALYQPHNYRVYFDFQKLGYRFKETDLLSSVFATYKFKIKNSSEHFFKGDDFSITVKRYSIEIINHVEHKRWYRVEVGGLGDYEKQIIDIVNKKNNECLDILKLFIKSFGGISGFRILNMRSEDKVTFEDSINKIPDKMTFHSQNGIKKVYNERCVEFNGVTQTVNYLENRALEKFAPEIANELSDIRKEFAETLKDLKNDALVPLTEQIRLHLEVLNNINKSLSDIRDIAIKPNILGFLKGSIIQKEDLFKFNSEIRKLSVLEGEELFDWWFTKFKT